MPPTSKPLRKNPPGPRDAQPLPRGRHGLSAETVRASQRQRLLQAMVELVAARGYAATTVPEVVAAARVSRNAFYEFFRDKEDCFLAVCEDNAAGLLEQMQGFGSEPDWLRALSQGLRAYLHWWQEREEFARAYFVEMPKVGERATAQRDAAYAGFARMFAGIAADARRQQPELAPLPAIVPRVVVSAVTEFIADEIRAGRGRQLTGHHVELLYLMVKLLADEASARRAVRMP
jgi:AcrR family transcriptional regulator